MLFITSKNIIIIRPNSGGTDTITTSNISRICL